MLFINVLIKKTMRIIFVVAEYFIKWVGETDLYKLFLVAESLYFCCLLVVI